MQSAIRAAVFSLMTLFASCGVGAQGLDTQIGKVAMGGERPTTNPSPNSMPLP